MRYTFKAHMRAYKMVKQQVRIDPYCNRQRVTKVMLRYLKVHTVDEVGGRASAGVRGTDCCAPCHSDCCAPPPTQCKHEAAHPAQTIPCRPFSSWARTRTRTCTPR